MSKTKAPPKESKLVSSFEEACEIKGYDPANVIPDVSIYPRKHHAAVIALLKLVIIAEALNEGWEPNWNDDDEYKYYPWFDMEEDKKANPSGFRFYVAGYAVAFSGTAGGSRLCFRTRKLAEHAGQTFLELYRDLMVLPKK